MGNFFDSLSLSCSDWIAKQFTFLLRLKFRFTVSDSLPNGGTTEVVEMDLWLINEILLNLVLSLRTTLLDIECHSPLSHKTCCSKWKYTCMHSVNGVCSFLPFTLPNAQLVDGCVLLPERSHNQTHARAEKPFYEWKRLQLSSSFFINELIVSALGVLCSTLTPCRHNNNHWTVNKNTCANTIKYKIYRNNLS